MLTSAIVRRVRESAGDINALQFSNSTLTDWINDGVNECVMQNSLLQARATTATVAGQSNYTLPADIFKLHSVWVDGIRLPVMTLQQWEERVGDPGDLNDPRKGASYSCYVYAGVLTLWPVPDVAGNSIVVNYTQLPAEIGYSAGPPESWVPDTPSIPQAFHTRLVTYCMAQVALQDDDYEKYQSLMTEFSTGVVSLRETKDAEDDLYPFITTSDRDMGNDYYG